MEDTDLEIGRMGSFANYRPNLRGGELSAHPTGSSLNRKVRGLLGTIHEQGETNKVGKTLRVRFLRRRKNIYY